MTLRMAYARSLAVVLEDVSAAQIVRARPRAAREANLARERRVRGGDEEPKRAVLRLGDAPANRGVRVRRARGRAPSRRLARRRGRRRGEVQNDEATAEPSAVERRAGRAPAAAERVLERRQQSRAGGHQHDHQRTRKRRRGMIIVRATLARGERVLRRSGSFSRRRRKMAVWVFPRRPNLPHGRLPARKPREAPDALVHALPGPLRGRPEREPAFVGALPGEKLGGVPRAPRHRRAVRRERRHATSLLAIEPPSLR